MKERLINLLRRNGKSKEAYEEKVVFLIRKRYTLSEELAILRQRDEKPEEYVVYNAYCEECKREAKAEIYGA